MCFLCPQHFILSTTVGIKMCQQHLVKTGASSKFHKDWNVFYKPHSTSIENQGVTDTLLLKALDFCKHQPNLFFCQIFEDMSDLVLFPLELIFFFYSLKVLSNGNGFLQRDTGGFFLQLFFVWRIKKKRCWRAQNNRKEDYYRFICLIHYHMKERLLR